MFQLRNRLPRGKTLAACLALPMSLLAFTASAQDDWKDAKGEQWKSGEHVYQRVCGHCHEAGVGPVIKGRQLPDAYITAIVRHGFRAMPAFTGAYIDDKSLAQVAEYISKAPAPAAKP